MKSWLLCVLLLLVPSLVLADENVSVIDVMLAQHNAWRAQAGLPPQVLDAGLTSYAQNLADRQAAAGRMFHSGSEWPWPECVCYGATDGNHAVTMWINSGPHRAILASRTRAVGFGFRNGFAAALFGEPAEPAEEGDKPTQEAAPAVQCANGSCSIVSRVVETESRSVSRVAVRSRLFGGRCGRGGCQ